MEKVCYIIKSSGFTRYSLPVEKDIFYYFKANGWLYEITYGYDSLVDQTRITGMCNFTMTKIRQKVSQRYRDNYC